MRLRRLREGPRTRYYLYISDSKLDMLFEQIDHSALRRISAELKVDLKIASVTLKRADNPAPTRAAKLRVVEWFIDRHHHVGTIDEPGNEYFRGRMEMAWGQLRGSHSTDEFRRGLVFFQGWQHHHAVVLAGRSRHVLGWAAGDDDGGRWGRSSHPEHILWALNEHISNTPELADLIREARYRASQWPGNVGPSVISSVLNEPFFWLTDKVLGRSMVQSVEFLAVPLLQEKCQIRRYHGFDDAHTVLGTPLYVAIASEPDATAASTTPLQTDGGVQ